MPPNGDTQNARDLPDDRLVAQCRWDAFRGPGPGGQKRNKTSSAVRVTHVPTGISATAGESRSQQQNRRAAFRRLRRRLTFQLRAPAAPQSFEQPAWYRALIAEGRLRVTQRHEHYLAAMGLILDVITESGGSVSQSAELLGISSANLVRFLQRDMDLLAVVNRLRQSQGLRALGGA